MKPDFQRRIQRYGWDKAAPYYELSWQDQLAPAQERLLGMADLKPGERVLDVACGTGLVTEPAAVQVGPEGEVVAVDLSDEMVESVGEKMKQNGLGQVSAHQMDAENLSLEDNRFDVALCSLGLMYVPDPQEAINEMCRVLGPGGRAVASVWGRRDQCGWAGLFPIVDKRVASDVCPLFFNLGTGETLKNSFIEAGFSEVTSERFPVSLHYDTPQEACDAAFWGGAVALAWDKFDEKTREEAEQEYLDSIARYRNGDGYDVPGEFVVVLGHKVN